MTELFVYGTLKRGGSNHHFLASQQFLGAARSVAGYLLYELDGYPGLVPDPNDRTGVIGELWAVDAPSLAALDELEGLAEGLYRRERIQLVGALATHAVQTYVYARSVAGRRIIGSVWPVA